MIGHLLVAEKHHVACVAQNRGDVRRDEKLLVAEADDDRRAIADRDDLLGVFDRHEHDREHAAHQFQCAADRLLQPVVAHLALHQVGDDLGVRFRLELVALRLQFLLQFEVVLDDPVMHDHDAAGAIPVGVRVLLGGATVRGPSRVAHAVESINGFVANRELQIGQLPGRATKGDALRTHKRDARRVIAAVFHAAQSVQQYRHNRL